VIYRTNSLLSSQGHIFHSWSHTGPVRALKLKSYKALAFNFELNKSIVFLFGHKVSILEGIFFSIKAIIKMMLD
jgi:hypothetical protein